MQLANGKVRRFEIRTRDKQTFFGPADIFASFGKAVISFARAPYCFCHASNMRKNQLMFKVTQKSAVLRALHHHNAVSTTGTNMDGNEATKQE